MTRAAKILGVASLVAASACSGPAPDDTAPEAASESSGGERPTAEAHPDEGESSSAETSDDDPPSAVGAGDHASAQVHVGAVVNEAGQGMFDPAIPQRLLRARAVAVAACYRAALAQHPGAGGTVQLDFTITTEGRVTNVSLSDDQVGVPEVTSCLTRVAERLRFVPGADGGDVIFGYTVRFTPD